MTDVTGSYDKYLDLIAFLGYFHTFLMTIDV